jgi:hypothetical protein
MSEHDHASGHTFMRRLIREYLIFVLALVLVVSGLVALSDRDSPNDGASTFKYSAF